jgi:pimeloyl-ACP methyl ester carboxylesterase
MSDWILLRGLTREAGHLGEFPGLLQQAFPGVRVVALDLPGNGGLARERSPLRLEAMAARAREDAARLGLTPPCRLLGLSMGGMVAVAWAQAHPGEVASCVLLSTSFAGFNPLHRRLRPEAWLRLLALAAHPGPAGKERRILDLTSCHPPAPSLVTDWAALRRSRPVRLSNALRQLLASARFRAPEAAPVPTLLLAGAGDRLVDPRCTEAMARRWACPGGIHPEAGHDLGLDAGDWVVAQILAWQGGPEASTPPSTG